MKKEEILQKAAKKHPVGEMESAKINKSSWIALIIAVVAAVVFMIVEGVLKHYSAIFAIAFICLIWASVFYFCQFFVAKRRYAGILIGAAFESLGAIAMLTFYILFNIGVF